MRTTALIMTTAALAACSTAPQPTTRAANKQVEYNQLIEGKTAGQPVNCLPRTASDDMRVIDDSTIVFRENAKTVYVNHMNGPCSNLGSGFTALVTKSFGTGQLCRGDIATVVDTGSKMMVGSCAYGEFVPYRSS